MTVDYYKIVTRSYCSPLQGGNPIFDGRVPFTTPKVALDTSATECAPGWNFCRSLPDAIKIAGLWPDGRPSRAFIVDPVGEVIERGQKCRAAQITFVREVTAPEWDAAIHEVSQVFGKHVERMARSQIAWRTALARPRHDPERVENCLREALRARGLDMWQLRRYEDARAAWDAWAARDALIVEYAAVNEWTKDDPLLLTTGLREAYENGLAIAVPVDKDTLGWAMEP